MVCLSHRMQNAVASESAPAASAVVSARLDERNLSLAVLGAFMLVVLSGVPLPYAAHAQSSSSMALSLSSDTAEEGAAITATMSFGNLTEDSDRSTTDYIFGADVVDANDADADACEEYGLGVDRYMYQVDEDPEVRTGRISTRCPAGDYTLEASIASPDGVKLASASAGFTIAAVPPLEEEDDPPTSAQQQTTPVDITLDSQNASPRGVWSDGTTV